MNRKKEPTQKINFAATTFISAYYINFQNYLLAFQAPAFLLIAGISFSVGAKSEENLSNKNIYKSIFDSYENWEWEDTSDWIISNNTVDEIGGWQSVSYTHLTLPTIYSV